MLKRTHLYSIITLVSFILPSYSIAKMPTTVKQQTIRAENTNSKGIESLILPYVFSTDSMGTVVGVGASIKGWHQPQLLIAATAFTGIDEDTRGFALGAWDYTPSWSDRLFISVSGSYGQYPKQRAYANISYAPNKIRPGSNESDKNDYIEAGGENNWLDIRLEYVLPIGAAKNDSIMTYKVQNGILVEPGSGGENWNPFEGGITNILLRQYNQTESFDLNYTQYEKSVHPFELGIGYDNTDYPVNPSTGSSQYLGVMHDFGWDGETSWTFWQFEASKYFSFGQSDLARQRVLALNFWTGDAPSWEENLNSSGKIELSGNPPQYMGASLGGFYRMRAYPSRRFHDQSVIYATAEYRYTPRWNPIGDISWLSWLKMDWWQIVTFVEGGRVASDYNASELLNDWKFDAGVGIRAYMATGVVRFDIAASDEGSSMWVMFSQPF
ncbi:MAG: BamA/TamA family outer membrane protein [Desulfotalea sp.]